MSKLSLRQRVENADKELKQKEEKLRDLENELPALLSKKNSIIEYLEKVGINTQDSGQDILNELISIINGVKINTDAPDKEDEDKNYKQEQLKNTEPATGNLSNKLSNAEKAIKNLDTAIKQKNEKFEELNNKIQGISMFLQNCNIKNPDLACLILDEVSKIFPDALTRVDYKEILETRGVEGEKPWVVVKAESQAQQCFAPDLSDLEIN